MSDTGDNLPAILGGTPIRPQGPPDWPLGDDAVNEAMQSALRDGSWGRYHGPHCDALRRRLAQYLECEHVLLCSSGTSAIELALRGMKVGPGDEVILAAYDYKANFQNVLAIGAVPVLVDVHPDNWNLDPANVETAITPRTRAFIASHLHGGVVPMPQVMEIARQHGVSVVEDACQMTGARVYGRRAGMWGDVGVISFGGSKLLTAGRGGAVFGNDAGIFQRIRLYAFRGNDAYPLSEMQATVLLPQLELLDERNERRTNSVNRLSGQLSRRSGLRVFGNQPSDSVAAYYKLGLQFNSNLFGGLTRDQFVAAVRAEGIAFDGGFRSLHRVHSAKRLRQVGELPVAEIADDQVVTLHHPVLLGGEHDIDQISQAVERVRASVDPIGEHLRQSD